MRLTSRMTPKELRKEIYSLRRQLRTNLKGVRELQKFSPLVPRYATNKMKELEKQMRQTSVRKMEEKELRNLYRDLNYISGLKSSTPAGAMETAERFEPLRQRLNNFSESLRDKFWRIYGKIYESSNGTIDKFKYTIFESDLIDEISSATDEDELVQRIIEEYDETYKELSKNASDNERQQLFTQKLSTLFK